MTTKRPVTIGVAGGTGSGKTTQIPKICLELKRGVHGLIGHTQPRRIAARTVASRIASLKEKAERYAAYSKLLRDSANATTNSAASTSVSSKH